LADGDAATYVGAPRVGAGGDRDPSDVRDLPPVERMLMERSPARSVGSRSPSSLPAGAPGAIATTPARSPGWYALDYETSGYVAHVRRTGRPAAPGSTPHDGGAADEARARRLAIFELESTAAGFALYRCWFIVGGKRRPLLAIRSRLANAGSVFAGARISMRSLARIARAFAGDRPRPSAMVRRSGSDDRDRPQRRTVTAYAMRATAAGTVDRTQFTRNGLRSSDRNARPGAAAYVPVENNAPGIAAARGFAGGRRITHAMGGEAA